jgi:hypothetical protein
MAVNRHHRKNQSRKERVNLPPRNRVVQKEKINLGAMASNLKRLQKKHVSALLRNFKQCLKKKDDRTYAMMSRISTLLVGVIFETEYVYRGCIPYCGTVPGFVRILKKPNFLATRLIIEQILYCRSNVPIGLIEKVIINCS